VWQRHSFVSDIKLVFIVSRQVSFVILLHFAAVHFYFCEESSDPVSARYASLLLKFSESFSDFPIRKSKSLSLLLDPPLISTSKIHSICSSFCSSFSCYLNLMFVTQAFNKISSASSLRLFLPITTLPFLFPDHPACLPTIAMRVDLSLLHLHRLVRGLDWFAHRAAMESALRRHPHLQPSEHLSAPLPPQLV
jgi:hypothetical protein